MTIDQKYEARLTALRLWANDVAARGFIAPSENDLAAIAIAKGVDAPGVNTDIVQAWQGAIRTLLKQVAFNIADPHRQLGREYDQPESAAAVPDRPVPEAVVQPPVELIAEEATVTASDGPLGKVDIVESSIELLKDWRSAAVDEGRAFANQLKDRDLRNVAYSKRDLASVQAQLPGFAQGFAQELVALLGTLEPQEAAAPAAAPERPSIPDSRREPVVAETVAQEAPQQPSYEPVAPPLAAAPEHHPASAAAAAHPGATSLDSGHGAAGGIDAGMFAAYDFMPSGGMPGAIKATKTQDGNRRYSWEVDGGPGDFKIYRLVSGDEMAPYTPDQADVIATTTELHALDSRPFSTAVRYLQVWSNSGRDQFDALNSQPVLHAMLDVVGEVPAIDIREDEGRIIGQWTALPGTAKVQIFRIPAAKAAFASSDPAYRILADGTNLGGFVDAEAQRGASYVYQVFTEATVQELNRLSAPVVVRMSVSAVLVQVEDLSVTVKAEDDDDTVLVDLTWTIPPGGRVDIYRTATRPTAGIELKPIEEATLEQAGLRPEFRLAHPIEPLDGVASMVNVPWPMEWTRTYFTPVTVLAGRAHVGPSSVTTRPTRIRNAKVVERVDSQILTFEWPDGADAVMVYTGATGHGPDAAMGGQPQEISHSGYNQRGGLYFSSLLPAEGCDLHLVPVSFEAGTRVSGTVTTVNYPWIMRVAYKVVPKKNRFTGKITGYSVAVNSFTPNVNLPGFVFVYNPGRLPLTASDGVALNMMRDMDGAAPGTRVFTPENRAPSDAPDMWKTDPDTWDADVKGRTGYVRLFPQVPLEVLKQLAVLDPSINELGLAPRGNSAWGLLGGR
ncbi:hypothetical protein [Arthrobacter sp. BF1]|uniref:hypothetical protein n=1 Tax=Arthrobacter sp. BF1 TaxID=2821145 RepID=UPI001C4FDAC7|nr:hypothetical protein [Arthrobacter sp. BF1]